MSLSVTIQRSSALIPKRAAVAFSGLAAIFYRGGSDVRELMLAIQGDAGVSIFKAFDRVKVISLRERTDRRRIMRRELARVGGSAEFYDAIRPGSKGPFMSPGLYGSFLSHQAIIRDAAWAGESVLIIEDDCNFLPQAKDYPLPPCDVFYGSHSEDAAEIVGAHCMGFSAKAVVLLDRFLSDFLHPDFEGEGKRVRPPIDGAYVWFRHRAHPELTTHFAELTYQRGSRSDCTPSHTYDRIPVVKELAEFARSLRPSPAQR